MKYITYIFIAGLMTLVLACGVSTEDIEALIVNNFFSVAHYFRHMV